MSSQGKRRAESEEVTHKKKLRKEGDKEDHFNQDDDGGLDVEDALDKDNTTPTDRRTRGKLEQVDYTKVGPVDDNSLENGEEMSKENEGPPTRPRTRSPQRKPAGDIKEEDEEEEDDDDDSEEGEYGKDENDDGTDEYYEEDEEE